jgi:hypothetical protein
MNYKVKPKNKENFTVYPGSKIVADIKGSVEPLTDGISDPITYTNQLKEINESILSEINMSQNKNQILDILNIWGKIINNSILFTFVTIDLKGKIPTDYLSQLSSIKKLNEDMITYVNDGSTESSSSSFW